MAVATAILVGSTMTASDAFRPSTKPVRGTVCVIVDIRWVIDYEETAPDVWRERRVRMTTVRCPGFAPGETELRWKRGPWRPSEG